MKINLNIILTTFLLFLIMPFNINAASIDKVNMNIFIEANGDAKINEEWIANPSEGTEAFKPYYNLGNSEIKDFTVSENNRIYSNLGIWNTNGSLSDKAYKSGINYITDGLELCWGISSYGSHSYNLSYTLTKFVKEYEDYQVIYFTLISHDMTPRPNNVEINIESEYLFDENNTKVWGYGWNGGVADTLDGKLVFDAQNGLEEDEHITILVQIPLGAFATEDTINEDFETVFWRAEEGVDLSGTDDSSNLFGILVAIVTIIFPLILIIALAKAGHFNTKNKRLAKENNIRLKIKDVHYFREIPCKKDLFRAYYTAYQYSLISENDKANLLGAILLKWLQEGKVKITKESKIFNRQATVIDITNDFICSNASEEALRELFIKAAGSNKLLEEKELEKWSKKNYTIINDWFDTVLDRQRDELINEDLIKKEEVVTLKVFKNTHYIIKSKFNEEATELLGLKKYLLEYSLIKQRESKEVALWNEYLIFAQILGIATQVEKEFKKVYPDFFQQLETNYNYNLTDWYFINSLCRSSVRGANAGYQAHINRMNSGGGGFSSGGGGGGSFGGGSGGGGFR